MNQELIAVIANLALTLSLIVALVFGILQTRAAARDRKERLTLTTLRNFQTQRFAEIMFTINQYDIPSTLEEWKKLPPEDQVMFMQFTQEMESLGLLVPEGFISIELVDKTLGSFVTSSWNRLSVVIADMRQKQRDPFLSEYFQWLAESLRHRMKSNPRKPFHKQK